MKNMKVIHILAHNVEDFMTGDYDDFDHHIIRLMEKIRNFSQQAGTEIKQELWTFTKKNSFFEVWHKNGFKIKFFPASINLPLPLEISLPMLKEVIKFQQRQGNEKLVWHLHSYYLFFYDLLAPLLWLKRQKFVMQFHGGGPAFRKLSSTLYSLYHYGIGLRLTLFLAKKIIVLNKDEEKRLKKLLFARKNKIFYMPSTIPKESIINPYLLEKFLSETYFKVICAGRMEKIKNKKQVLELMKEILTENKWFVFEIIGMKKPDREIIDFQNQFPLQVILTEWLPKQALLERLREGSVYLHFFPFNEGSPIALIEALSQGAPAITFDVEGVRDAIKDGYNGWLVKNIRDFKEKILEAAKNPDMRQIKRNCLAEILKNFTDEKYLPKLIDIYLFLSRL